MSKLHIVSVDRSTLFYGEFEYCVSINIAEAGCLRNLNPSQFESAVRKARHWAQHPQSGRMWSDTKELALRETRDLLLAESTPFKTVISYNMLSIYTNNVTLAKKLDRLGPWVVMSQVRQAKITLPAGVIQLRSSQYAYRTYFRERKYSREQRAMLLNFLNSRQGTLRASPSLMWWLTYEGHKWQNPEYSRSHYFVDHDHPNEGTMLSLVLPSIVRKTMPIETY